MNTRLTIITFLALGALATAAAAQGPGRQQGNRARAPRAVEHRLERLDTWFDHSDTWLDLSAEQETAIDAIHEKAREQAVELRKQQARLQNEIDGELLADEPSEQTLVKLAEELGAVRTELQVIRLKTRLAVRAELTDEQRDQFLLRGGRGGGHQGLHRRRGGRGGDEMFRHFRHGRRFPAPDGDDDDGDQDEI